MARWRVAPGEGLFAGARPRQQLHHRPRVDGRSVELRSRRTRTLRRAACVTEVPWLLHLQSDRCVQTNGGRIETFG